MNAPLDHRAIRGHLRWSFVAGGVGVLLAMLLAALILQSAAVTHRNDARTALQALEQSREDGRELARKVLKSAPYTPTLLRGLGLAAERDGDQAAAVPLMVQAGRLTRRDAVTNGWLINYRFAQGDYKAALQSVDALLRIRPELTPTVIPVLGPLSVNPRLTPAFVEGMVSYPVWRDPLLRWIGWNAPPEATFALMNMLNATKARPSEGEATTLVTRLAGMKRYDEALLAVLLFLPPARLESFSGLFNGDFDDVRGILPFDWAIDPAGGASVAMEKPTPKSSRALHVISDGRTEKALISQVMVLTPGRYRLTGEVMSQTLPPNASVQLSIACIEGASLWRGAPAASEHWRPFSIAFDVPHDCPGQNISIVPTPGERREGADVWYDKLAIKRAGS